MSDPVQTMRVRVKATDGELVINVADFDAALYESLEPAPAAPLSSTAQASADEQLKRLAEEDEKRRAAEDDARVKQMISEREAQQELANRETSGEQPIPPVPGQTGGPGAPEGGDGDGDGTGPGQTGGPGAPGAQSDGDGGGGDGGGTEPGQTGGPGAPAPGQTGGPGAQSSEQPGGDQSGEQSTVDVPPYWDIIAPQVGTVENARGLTKTQLIALDGIGKPQAAEIIEWFKRRS